MANKFNPPTDRNKQHYATRTLAVYADASVYPHATGLGAVIKDARGNLIAWRKRAIGALTSNEAEYHALIFALEQAQTFAPRELQIFSDSKLVVEQMRGMYRVQNERLRALHRRAGALVERFERVTFTHISRERNQLADAIADDAVSTNLKTNQRMG
ncbi:MAG: ribonuclease HI family protein [Chloroflexi bacterium]|nr:ribonuclease HI family protein [Chloroflexota bacterium]